MFLEGMLRTLDLIIFCFSAGHPLAESFEFIDGNVFVKISKTLSQDCLPWILIESRKHWAPLITALHVG